MKAEKIYSLLMIVIAAGTLQAAQPDVDWLVVGAGPSGIATVGVLLDVGIAPEKICWLDPEFNVGRLGAFYFNVPANSKTKEFVYFVNACKSFQDCKCPAVQALNNYDPESRGNLGLVIEPLQCITNHLRTRVHAVQESLTNLYFNDGLWRITTDKNKNISAYHVVLATGSRPKTLAYEQQKIIPLDSALDQSTLRTIVQPTDIVGVVGNAHSAILLLKFLSEMPVAHIYNLYKSPIIYAPVKGSMLDKGIAMGIKGIAAEWAQNVLEKNPPKNLTRILSTPENLAATLAQCTKVIYAIGYERNPLPLINGTTPIQDYEERTGIIAPRLFGIGVAFPEKRTAEDGKDAFCIGLDCFMEYAQQIVPYWVAHDQERSKLINEQMKLLKNMEELFTIYAL